ncbi:MAG: endonuclease III [Firmicutes bacterium]|nr:endonuclease III [Bacillota bacterium]
MVKARDREILARLKVAYPDARCGLSFENPYQLLVATILSAQSTDKRVNALTPALFAAYPDAEALCKADLDEIERMIQGIGLYHNKARFLKECAEQLCLRFGRNVPDSFEALITLPGVGRKTANVVLANAFGQPTLAVDTHVFRVSHRLGLADAKTPEQTEAQLRQRIPKDHWVIAHHVLIAHGRQTCIARSPHCATCPVLDLCPWGQRRENAVRAKGLETSAEPEVQR